MPRRTAALNDHARQFILDGNWTRVLAVADIYKNGLFPDYLPDETVALKLYHVCSRCPDGEVAGLGQARYVETRLDPVAVEDRRGAPLPRDPAEIVETEAVERIAATAFADFQVPARPSAPAAKATVPPPLSPAATASPPQRAPLHLSDAQNSHDHGVTTSIRKNIQQLLKISGSSACFDPSVETARDAILCSDEPAQVKEDALEVLDHLRDAVHSTYDVSEKQVLDAAIRTIEKQDPETSRNLKETLVKQLATGVESGNVVCSSGKVARIVSAFEGTDVLQTDGGAADIKPMWAVRQEMAALAARIRDRFEGDEAGGAREFEKQAADVYISQLGLNAAIVNKVIEEYAQAF